MDTDQAKGRIAELVKSYQAMKVADKRRLNEEATKLSFILPLFGALGWNVTDNQEVAPEEKAFTGRVDFTFKINGVSQFYLEAKKPSVNIDDEIHATQVLTYAYGRGIPWAVLTNFEAVRVFNAEREVSLHEAAFLRLSAQNYVEKFEDLWLLSKEAFEKKALDEKAQLFGKAKLRMRADERLLKQMLTWRNELIKDLYQYGKTEGLTLQQLDHLVQQLLNRLIFIRSAEDRGIEDKRLRALVNQSKMKPASDVLKGLRQVLKKYADSYDSELFPELMDPWLSIHLDSTRLVEVLEGVYGPPGEYVGYDFKALDADVMGKVYEQYLGYRPDRVLTQRVRVSSQKELEGLQKQLSELAAKPVERKGKGVYYTPSEVVQYIVSETVGRFIGDNRRDRIHEIKILDPACGSGSFLIRAYDELLRYHAQSSDRPVDHIFADEREIILKNSIFGVDLDPQAVEIARLNLLLRMLVKRERLPQLHMNIRTGNSLISDSAEELDRYFGKNWEEGKRPFSWDTEFKDIMTRGGFDVVLGNPPYVRIQNLDRVEADYLREHYKSAHGSFDIYVAFIERGLQLLKPGGFLGFITSGKFLKAQYGEKLRELLYKTATVERIIDLSERQVFADVTTYPVILILRKGQSNGPLFYALAQPQDAGQASDFRALSLREVPQESILEGVWPPSAGKAKTLMDKMGARSAPLGSLADHVFTGLQTSADAVYVLDKRGKIENGKAKVHSRALDKEVVLETALLKPLLSGKHVERYFAKETRQLLLFPYRVSDGEATLIAADEFEKRYPQCWRYLSENRRTLEERENGKMRHERWYAFGRTQSLGLHDFRKLAIPRLVHRLQAFYDTKGEFYLDNVDVGGLILSQNNDRDYKFVVGLLNSKLLDWYFRQRSVPFRGGFRSANRQYLEPLPIRRVDPKNAKDKAMYDRLVTFAERMVELQERLAGTDAYLVSERESLERSVAQTDGEIDELVYDLYGLTKEERRMVEEETKGKPHP